MSFPIIYIQINSQIVYHFPTKDRGGYTDLEKMTLKYSQRQVEQRIEKKKKFKGFR
jgi:hypothetical protein